MIIEKTIIKKQHLPNLERAGMITTQATHSTNPEIKLLQRVHVREVFKKSKWKFK